MSAFRKFILCLSVIILIGSCRGGDGEENPLPGKGNRMLGIHITQAEGGTFDDAFTLALDAGMDCCPQTFFWNMLEDQSGYDPHSYLELINHYYPARNTAVSLCITPIETIYRGVPADLMEVPFGSPQMISRFKQLLDTIHAATPDLDLRFLIIGNEVDLYFDAHPGEWEDYITFIAAVVPHAKALWGEQVMAGAESTLMGALGTHQEKVKRMNEHTDMVCFSYYPLDPGFVMKPVDQVEEVIDRMMQAYPDRKMFLEECGYAGSETCNSSDAEQSDFIGNMFRIWDKYRDRLLFMGFLWLHDLSPAQAQLFAVQYGISGQQGEEAFTEYVRSCGLRQFNGAAKPAFLRLKTEAGDRGW